METTAEYPWLSPASMVPDRHRIAKVRKEAHDTFTLFTEPVSGDAVAGFAPGQFNMLYVFGAGEVPISISGDPAGKGPTVHTIRAVGTVTRRLAEMKKGDTLGLRGPYGSSWPLEKAAGNDVVIVAGGLGLAPVRPAIYHLLRHRERFGSISILYGARTPADMLFLKELEQWRGRFDLHVDVTVDTAHRGWAGNVGVVTQLIAKATFDPDNSLAFICGPEIMMRFTVMELLKQGLEEESVFLSLERNMKCAIGFCGHCQYGPHFICKDGPVFAYPQIRNLFTRREV